LSSSLGGLQLTLDQCPGDIELALETWRNIF
jgi:hypothetical protein